MTQEAFDFNAAPARPTDPVTSQIAADANREMRSRHRRLALSAHYRNRRGLTDFELAEATGIGQTSIGKRRHELMTKMAEPLIEKTAETRPAPSGSPATVWRITEAGVRFYEREVRN